MPSAARFARYFWLGACQMPEKSGLPSAVLGAGAFRFALPSGRRGIPGVGRFNHCACAVAAATRITPDARVTRSANFTVVLLIRTLGCTRNIHLSDNQRSSSQRRSDRSNRSGRSVRSDRSSVVRNVLTRSAANRIERGRTIKLNDSNDEERIERPERFERSERR